MPGLLTHYRAFFQLPGVLRLLVTALVARMPIGMMSLSLLMHLRELSGSFAFAGGIVGTYFVAMAAGAPIQGRLADRSGPRGILLATGIVQPVALGLLLFAAPLHLSLTAIAPLAMIAGAFMPPISVLTRTLWRHRFERPEDRRTAFAVDSVLIEINFTIGPALVGMALLFGTPTLAFGLTWLVAASAAPLFALSGAPRYWKSSAHEAHHLLGPLTEPKLLIAYATSTALTFSFGMLEVGYPGFAARAGMPALGGALLAICSIGSALGGVAYGGMHFALPFRAAAGAAIAAVAAAAGGSIRRTRLRHFCVGARAARLCRRIDDRAGAHRAVAPGHPIRPGTLRHRSVHLDVDMHLDRGRRRDGGWRPAHRGRRPTGRVRLSGGRRGYRGAGVVAVAAFLAAIDVARDELAQHCLQHLARVVLFQFT
jgi:MFS family permease